MRKRAQRDSFIFCGEEHALRNRNSIGHSQPIPKGTCSGLSVYFKVVAFLFVVAAWGREAGAQEIPFSFATKDSAAAARLYLSTSEDPLKIIIVKNNSINYLFHSKTNNLKSSLATVLAMDSVYSYLWNANIQDWDIKPYRKFIKDYNNTLQINSSTQYELNSENQNWEAKNKIYYIYIDNKLDSTVLQNFINEKDLINSQLELYKYDDSNRKIEYESLSWDQEDNLWVHNWKHNFVYSSNDRLDTIYESFWNNTLSNWELTYRYINKYDGNSNVIKAITQTWSSEQFNFINEQQIIYLYNTKGYNDTIISQNWSTQSSDWTNNVKKQIDFDNQGRALTYETLIWNKDSVKWLPRKNGNYLYEDNNSYSLIEKIYNSSTKSYINSFKSEEIYNTVGFEISNSSIYWDNSANRWNSGSKNANYYSGHDYSNEINNINFNASIYPNPAFNLVNIESKNEVCFIVIYDIKGNPMISNANIEQKNITIKINELKPGLYFLSIMDRRGNILSYKILKK